METERARWEGAMEARMGDAERRLDAINGSITIHASATNDLAIRVGGLALKVSIMSGIGGAVGGTILAVAAHFAR